MVLVQILLHANHLLFGRFEQNVNSPQNHHWQNDFLVFALVKSIYKYVCRNIPDKRKQRVILCLFHYFSCMLSTKRSFMFTDRKFAI